MIKYIFNFPKLCIDINDTWQEQLSSLHDMTKKYYEVAGGNWENITLGGPLQHQWLF